MQAEHVACKVGMLWGLMIQHVQPVKCIRKSYSLV